jgi:dipeptide transport system permease protein
MDVERIDAIPVQDIGEPAFASQSSPLLAFWSGFRENKGAMFGLTIVVFVVAMALLASLIAPHSPIEQFRDAVKAPPVWEAGGSWRFILGTDGAGRDMLSRIIYGARVSLFIGLCVMSVSFVVGIVLGLASVMAGPVADVAITRLMDLILAVPSLVLAILVVAILGPSLTNTIVAVTIVYLPRYVRLMRASALGELSKDYVTAARVVGVGLFRLMFVTILPNCLAPLIVQALLSRAGRTAADAGMGFDARRFPGVHSFQPLDRHLSGPRHSGYCRCDQSDRRRFARRARSAHAAELKPCRCSKSAISRCPSPRDRAPSRRSIEST